jgi:hypothetical protein
LVQKALAKNDSKKAAPKIANANLLKKRKKAKKVKFIRLTSTNGSISLLLAFSFHRQFLVLFCGIVCIL